MRPAKKKKSLFSSRIAALRRSRGLTQEALASALGVDRGRVCYWENKAKNPTAATVNLLAEYFGMGPEYFLAKNPNSLPTEFERKAKEVAKLPLEKQKEATRLLDVILKRDGEKETPPAIS